MEILETCLEDIEARLVPEQEDTILRQWKQFASGHWETPVFEPVREIRCESGVEWPAVNINDALADPDLMIVDQFRMVSEKLASGSGGLLTVRANYGVGILPSLFGVEKFVMPREMNTLPNVRAFPEGTTAIRKIADGPVPGFDNGYGPQVFAIGERYEAIYRRYPKIARYVRTDHPDCQGPMDVCELLWGSEMFLGMLDEPELMHRLLRVVTDTYKGFLDAWFRVSPRRTDDLHAYFGHAHLGSITVRDDSAMNLSPEAFREFILPYDQEVLDHFGGGSIHFCGRGDHFVPFFTEMPAVRAMNMSQPEYNDMETIYRATVDRGLPIIGMPRPAVDAALADGRDLRGMVSV